MAHKTTLQKEFQEAARAGHDEIVRLLLRDPRVDPGPAGEPPLITIGDEYVLWDSGGRARRDRLFVACSEAGLDLQEPFI